MLEKLRKIKIKELLSCFLFLPALFFGLILKLVRMLQRKPIWLICEIENIARDNGYHFFIYMRENHPEIDVYYAINPKSSDYQKLIKYQKYVIKFGSFKHYVYYIAAKWNISSHKEGNPNHLLFTVLHLYLKLFNNRVFLQHGITKDNVKMFYYKNTYFKKFICGAKPEYNYISKVFGYQKV